MRVNVLLFASIRDHIGQSELNLDMPEGSTVADLSRRLANLYPAAGPLLSVCRFALGDAYAESSDPLRSADPVGVIPPVSGGSSQAGSAAPRPQVPASPTPAVHAEIVRAPIDMQSLVTRVASSESGAVLTFAGAVRADRDGDRSVVGIEYEGYEPMALKVLREIAETTARTRSVAVAAAHRLGRLAIGEISVGIAVSAGHRGTGFDALREVIERIKADLPIWKKEEFSNGAAEWVGAHAARGGRT